MGFVILMVLCQVHHMMFVAAMKNPGDTFGLRQGNLPLCRTRYITTVIQLVCRSTASSLRQACILFLVIFNPSLTDYTLSSLECNQPQMWVILMSREVNIIQNLYLNFKHLRFETKLYRQRKKHGERFYIVSWARLSRGERVWSNSHQALVLQTQQQGT